MIDRTCQCGASITTQESQLNRPTACRQCGRAARFVSAEALRDGEGAVDFDTHLVVTGPGREGEIIFLGGCAEIGIGKLSDNAIQLMGAMVSRSHAKLVRLDFGPSRWRLVDCNSRNGLFVNGQRVNQHELAEGDAIRVGEFELRYAFDAAAAPVLAAMSGAAPPPVSSGDIRCPSCCKSLPTGTRICVDCGVDVKTGRPLVMRRGMDEDALYVKAENTIRAISWIMPTGLYPVASEAFGSGKPYAIWSIFLVTLIASAAFLAGSFGASDLSSVSGAGMMLWTGDPLANIMEDDEAADLFGEDSGDASDAESREFLNSLRDTMRKELPPSTQFHWYQLLTHAFLHGGLMHFAGNMVFLLVLGTRVNALIGDLKTAIIYPLLAVAGGVGHMLASATGPLHPMVGASGAVMGLAGLYLVLFPVHRVYMAIWLRLGMFTGWKLLWKMWPVRGFWVVLFYISFDVVLTAIGAEDNVAHWAHLGGFGVGVSLGLILLIARQVNAHGGDLLSVLLGRHAWALIGKPSQWQEASAAEPVAAVQ